MNSGKTPIRLGLMAPFTGLVELYGPEISWAGQIATDEINENGGLLGRPLELVIVDDGSLPDTAVPAANRLVDEEGCVAIIGNLLSNSRISVASMVADPKKVPHLNFSFHEGSIWSRYFFHFAALPNQQIEKMIPYMADHFGFKMFFAGSNYEWPRGSIDAAKHSLLEHGGEVVGESYLPFGTESFDDLLDLVEASGADVFVPYFAGSDQTNLLTQFSGRGLKKRMAVVMGHYDEAMVGSLPPDVREGFFSSNTYFMSVDTPENWSYLDRLGARDGVSGVWPNGNGVLTNFGEGTYVCVKAFAAAVEKAGSTDAEDLVQALESIKVQGPQGLVEMDPATHHARVNTHLAQCNRDGTFALVKSFGSLGPVIPERYRELFPALQSNSDSRTNEKKNKISAYEIEVGSNEKNVVIKTDRDGNITDVNANMEDFFGYTAKEAIGLSIHLLLPPHLRDQHRMFFNKFIESDRFAIAMGEQGQVFGYRKDGSMFPARVGVTKVRKGGDIEVIATLFDITEQIESGARVLHQTTHDVLTGLGNRSLLKERLTNALARSSRYGNDVYTILLDIDGFRSINERQGFDVGDRVLTKMAKILTDEAGPGDIVGRFGGDEFLVISEGVESLDDVDGFLQRVNARMSEAEDIPAIALTARTTVAAPEVFSVDDILRQLQP